LSGWRCLMPRLRYDGKKSCFNLFCRSATATATTTLIYVELRKWERKVRFTECMYLGCVDRQKSFYLILWRNFESRKKGKDTLMREVTIGWLKLQLLCLPQQPCEMVWQCKEADSIVVCLNLF
jgi:hypothetical protein